MLRILLPPNLAAAAKRDAIAIRLELDLTATPPPTAVAGLAILQRIGAKPAAVSFLQLTRAQLAELTDALTGQSVFFWINQTTKPIPWNGGDLVGVDDYLAVTSPAPALVEKNHPSVSSAKKPASEPDWKPMIVDGSEHFLAITLPSREADNYHEIWDLLKRHGFILEPTNGKFWLRNRHKALNFLATYGTELREHHGAEFTENFEHNTRHIQPVGVVAEAREQDEGYDVTLALKAGKASETEILNAVNTSRGYIESGGEIYLVDPTRLAKLQAAHQALAGQREDAGGLRRHHRIARARVAEAQEILAETAPHFQPPATWREQSEALLQLSTLSPAPVPPELLATLRPYQKVGVAWMWYLYN